MEIGHRKSIQIIKDPLQTPLRLPEEGVYVQTQPADQAVTSFTPRKVHRPSEKPPHPADLGEALPRPAAPGGGSVPEICGTWSPSKGKS